MQIDANILAKLSQGGVGVMPTDTVYGVVCSASHPEAIRRLYQAKQRENKPGTVLAAGIDQLVEFGIPRRYLKPVEHYWPNAISIVIPVGQLHTEIHGGSGTIAVRIPKDDALRSVLEKTGPLLTSSANITGQPPATTIEQAKNYFGDSVDFYVDGGDLSGREPSTVIRIIDDAVEILRPGAVKINEAGEIVDDI